MFQNFFQVTEEDATSYVKKVRKTLLPNESLNK